MKECKECDYWENVYQISPLGEEVSAASVDAWENPAVYWDENVPLGEDQAPFSIPSTTHMQLIIYYTITSLVINSNKKINKSHKKISR